VVEEENSCGFISREGFAWSGLGAERPSATGLSDHSFFGSVTIRSPLVSALWIRFRSNKESGMRKLPLAGFAVGALIMPAAAADMTPYYRTPLQAQPFYWTEGHAEAE
jgi:hypothetical protein